MRPFSKNDMALMRRIVTATIEASPERQAVRSASRVADLYMGLVNALAEQSYVPELRMIEVRLSYRKLAGRISGGLLCAKNGQPLMSIKEHTISKYVRLLVDMGMATYTEAGWALVIPTLDHWATLPKPVPRPTQQRPERKVVVRVVRPELPAEPYPWSELPPVCQAYVGRRGIAEDQWRLLSRSEREHWYGQIEAWMTERKDEFLALLKRLNDEGDADGEAEITDRLETTPHAGWAHRPEGQPVGQQHREDEGAGVHGSSRG